MASRPTPRRRRQDRRSPLGRLVEELRRWHLLPAPVPEALGMSSREYLQVSWVAVFGIGTLLLVFGGEAIVWGAWAAYALLTLGLTLLHRWRPKFTWFPCHSLLTEALVLAVVAGEGPALAEAWGISSFSLLLILALPPYLALAMGFGSWGSVVGLVLLLIGGWGAELRNGDLILLTTAGVLVGAIGWALNRSHRRVSALQRELETLAWQDPLTGLLNRRALSALAPQILARAQRRGEPVTALFLDLDEFKTVNDRFGHAEGDRVLQEIAHRFRTRVRNGDYLFRLGGDEFLILLPGATEEQAQEVLERVARALEDLDLPDGTSVGVSGGIASSRQGIDSLAELLKQADVHMYAHKRRKEGEGDPEP